MTDDLENRCHEELAHTDGPVTRKLKEQADRIDKLERDVLEYSSAVADAQMRNEELDRALNRIIDRWEAQKARIEKLEAALRKIKDLHHGPEDEEVVIIRDDMTYFIVCEALGETA